MISITEGNGIVLYTMKHIGPSDTAFMKINVLGKVGKGPEDTDMHATQSLRL